MSLVLDITESFFLGHDKLEDKKTLILRVCSGLQNVMPAI